MFAKKQEQLKSLVQDVLRQPLKVVLPRIYNSIVARNERVIHMNDKLAEHLKSMDTYNSRIHITHKRGARSGM